MTRTSEDAPHAPDSARPWAQIDLEALTANIVHARRSAPDAAVDATRDGWGHGVDNVLRAARAAGATSALVDPGTEGRAPTGIAIVPTASAVLDPDTVYGLPTGAGVPVLRVGGRILSTKSLRRGEGVSYGYIHRASEDTRIGLVTGGYAQGLVRAGGSAVNVAVGGMRRPVIGRIAMDVCVVDLGPAAVVPGDDVIFFGPAEGEPSLDQWCAATGLSAAEIVAIAGRSAEVRAA